MEKDETIEQVGPFVSAVNLIVLGLAFGILLYAVGSLIWMGLSLGAYQ